MPTSRKPITDEVQLRIPFATSSVPLVRHRLDTWLTEHDPAASPEDARIVASELVANAVKHARPMLGGGLLVTWRLAGGALHLAVTDGGGISSPVMSLVAESATSGRGLRIVQQVATRWWVESTGSSTTVHALLAL